MLNLVALAGIPEIRPGDDIAAVIIRGLAATDVTLAADDVVVIAQKIVSKAENRYADLRAVTPSPAAVELARRVDKDPRLVELILSESTEVVACRAGVLIVAHRLGFVLANAGIDISNVGHPAGEEKVLLLPVDPDGNSARIRAALRAAAGVDVGVVISDSIGRAWRRGAIGMAIGASGIPALLDLRGNPDRDGRKLEVTETGLADEIASAASLLMGQADEGRPVVLVRGLHHAGDGGRAADLIRPRESDLFR